MELQEIMITLGMYVPLIVVFVICIALEIFLANRQSRWPGLVLPGCWLLPPMFVLPNVFLNALSEAESASGMLLALLVPVILLAPMLVLLAIYWFCRRRRKNREQIEKMKIQDL